MLDLTILSSANGSKEVEGALRRPSEGRKDRKEDSCAAAEGGSAGSVSEAKRPPSCLFAVCHINVWSRTVATTIRCDRLPWSIPAQ